LLSWEFRVALSGGDRGQFSSVVVTLSCTSKTVLVTGAEACGVTWAGCLVFLFLLSDCSGLFLLGVLLERDGGRDSVVSAAFFCFSIVGTASSGAVLVVLVTNAAGTCGNVWVDTDFLLFVRGRHSTGKGGILLGNGLAGFAFLCSFTGGGGFHLVGQRVLFLRVRSWWC
jgi:hypothetical protein